MYISCSNSGKIKLNVKHDYDKLNSVIIGYWKNFHDVEFEVVNATQEEYFSSELKPTKKTLEPQFNKFEKALVECGVKVYHQQSVSDVPDQLTPRDIGFVIGSIFVVAGMAKVSRKKEYIGIEYLFDMFDGDALYTPENVVLEGGDVIVDGNDIFVGLSQRTDKNGLEFLKEKFSGYNIVPVYLKPPGAGEDVLHLDCAFNPLCKDTALIYPEGFIEIPIEITEKYKDGFIAVTKDEQENLGTNILQLSPEKLISGNQLVSKKIQDYGFDVIEIEFTEAEKTGGSFHCCSLPLNRGGAD